MGVDHWRAAARDLLADHHAGLADLLPFVVPAAPAHFDNLIVRRAIADADDVVVVGIEERTHRGRSILQAQICQDLHERLAEWRRLRGGIAEVDKHDAFAGEHAVVQLSKIVEGIAEFSGEIA